MLIAISGKIGVGKDLCAKIIQHLIYCKYIEKELIYEDRFPIPYIPDQFQIKKFAGKLKDIVCLLIGCTREQLEDQEFKNKELGEEWIRYAYANGHNDHYRNEGWTKSMNAVNCSKERYEEERRINWQTAYKTILTPRLLLQLIGTEYFRDIIHPNININALFSDYKKIGFPPEPLESICDKNYPNWIITDVRFENEAKAIKDRNGILIRVNRYNVLDHSNLNNHPSETDLDSYKDFDYIIENNESMEKLVEQVKQILIKEKII